MCLRGIHLHRLLRSSTSEVTSGMSLRRHRLFCLSRFTCWHAVADTLPPRDRGGLCRTIRLRPRRCIPPRLPSVAAVALLAPFWCGAPGCVHPAGIPCVISYASSPPSLHSCRVPPPRTWRLLRRLSPPTPLPAWRTFFAVQTRLARPLATVTVFSDHLMLAASLGVTLAMSPQMPLAY
jgi:hypothetical protein